MEKSTRDFKGVWIPKELWLTDKLSLMEKVIFVEIQSLDNERGCFAANNHFADFFGISPRQVSTHISSLKAKGYISLKIENYNQRTIRALGKWKRVSTSDVMKLSNEMETLVKKLSLPKSYPQAEKIGRRRQEENFVGGRKLSAQGVGRKLRGG